ncbi:c-type cytochrome [Helicobacter sp.]|uniref:c-type cytochrome n=1 Tax=Helicobacter sp. TaxID=218 RepID=UPI0025B9DEAC|nr:c-type cytochrome [Helicobacter sp.]
MYNFLLICVLSLVFVACSQEDKDTSASQIQSTLDSQHTSNATQVSQEASDLPTQAVVETTDSHNVETPSVESSAEPKKSDAVALYAKCAACHGKDGRSVAPGSVGNVLIASLNKAQVVEALKGFRARTLSKGGNSVIMYMQAKNLSDEDIEALAEYINAF